MTRVAVATTSQIAADAARETSALGGNAVDCALAAALVSMNTEPGVCALAGGAYITIARPGADVVCIDGNVAVPGAGLPVSALGHGAEAVTMAYGGGVTTLVGAGSVAVPGTPAAVEMALDTFGSLGWKEVLAAAIRAARDGFPLPAACHYYLAYSGKPIYARSDEGFAALHHCDKSGTRDQASLRDAGSRIVVPYLADSLELIAKEGARAFYHGELGAALSKHCCERGGSLTTTDLAGYTALPRAAIVSSVGDWQVASNPPPAIGGAMLTAMLQLFADTRATAWDAQLLRRLIDVQKACLRYRKLRLATAGNFESAVASMLQQAASGQLLSRWSSSATVHTSAVDEDGLACAVTASAGYGSGEMPAGTGLWLNNCLGELELNPQGVAAAPVGARLPSNMAPTIARSASGVLAVGSPGADRITTAIHQFLVNHLLLGMPLEQAIRHPRLHYDTSTSSDRLMVEAGIDMPKIDEPVMQFAGINMYFGGVAAASYSTSGEFAVAADPRRAGGTCNT
jgi:gamma-glutamyltranspeptidase/glutathione hydrolase